MQQQVKEDVGKRSPKAGLKASTNSKTVCKSEAER
jgi:hypothetical protein